MFQDVKLLQYVANCAIFCLAPKEETADDFWLMIWNENISVIAALVLLIEGGKVSIRHLLYELEECNRQIMAR